MKTRSFILPSAIVAAALFSGCTSDPVSVSNNNPTSAAVAKPDLKIGGFVISRNVAGSMTFTTTIYNIGTAAIPNIKDIVIQLNYSENTTFGDADDIGCAGYPLTLNQSLAAGASINISKSMYENSWRSEKKYILAKIDYGNIISESNENNNTAQRTVLADLVVNSISFTSGQGSNPITYTQVLRNCGWTSVDLYDVVCQRYFSIDGTYSSDDIGAGAGRFTTHITLGHDETLTQNSSVARPNSTYKYLIVKIDNLDIVSEIKELNNSRCVALP